MGNTDASSPLPRFGMPLFESPFWLPHFTAPPALPPAPFPPRQVLQADSERQAIQSTALQSELHTLLEEARLQRAQLESTLRESEEVAADYDQLLLDNELLAEEVRETRQQGGSGFRVGAGAWVYNQLQVVNQ